LSPPFILIMDQEKIPLDYPSALDLLIFFGTEPIEEGDVTTYEVQDDSGLVLSFSFDTSEGSIQTIVKQYGRVVSLTSQECLTRMWIDGDTFRAEFESGNYRITLAFKIYPFLQLKWSGLRVR